MPTWYDPMPLSQGIATRVTAVSFQVLVIHGLSGLITAFPLYFGDIAMRRYRWLGFPTIWGATDIGRDPCTIFRAGQWKNPLLSL